MTDEGQSLSAFVSVVVVALLLMAGLVIDGGAQLSAGRRAEAAAASAARAGADAEANARVGGERGAAQAIATSRTWLARQRVDGDAHIEGQSVVVNTRIVVPTMFLSLIGVDHLTARGSATASLRRG